MLLVQELDPILKEVCKLFDFSDSKIDPEEYARNLHHYMLEKNGIGLASPQVGINLRVFVMGNNENFYACFNPEILETSQKMIISSEGCLSFPKLYLNVERPEWITVRYTNEKQKVIEEKFTDLWARCYSHELDHLDGICFIKKVGSMSLQIAKQKRNKMLRREKNGDFRHR